MHEPRNSPQCGRTSHLRHGRSQYGRDPFPPWRAGPGRPVLRGALAIFRDLGDQWLLSVSLHGLAMTGIREGADERATQALHESLHLAAQLGENYWVAENLEALAAVAQRADRLDEAARLLSASDKLGPDRSTRSTRGPS